MKKETRKEITFAIVGCLLLIFVVIGVSYGVFTFSQAGQVSNTITTGTITFTYNEESNGITITNAQPMTDAAGMILAASDPGNGIIQGYFDFSVSGNITGTATVNYEIFGTVDKESTMDPNYIKVYLTDGSSNELPMAGYEGKVIPVYGSLPTAVSDSAGKRLYYSSFSTGNLSKKFRLRLWVADTYTVADASKTFSMHVNVSAVG